ncbi:hypothetical protein SCUP234_07167 [Seiridium cupressi]
MTPSHHPPVLKVLAKKRPLSPNPSDAAPSSKRARPNEDSDLEEVGTAEELEQEQRSDSRVTITKGTKDGVIFKAHSSMLQPSEALLKHADNRAENGRTWFKIHRPPITTPDLEMMILHAPSEFDKTYTAQDEAKLQEDWANDPLRTHRLNHGHDNKMLKLWKLPPRLWPGTFAEHIISDRHDLAFEQEPTARRVKVNGESVLHPYWGSSFCSALAKLLVHPFWLGDLHAMAICIQYAVICRTRDQRKGCWPRRNPTDSKFLDMFRHVTESKQDGTCSIVDLHTQVRKQTSGVPSLTSRLFLEVERIAFHDGDTLPQSQAIGPYKVRYIDLQCLVDALERVSDYGMPIFLPSQCYDDAFKYARHSYDAPKKAQMEQYREQVLLDILRSNIKNQKSNQSVHGNSDLDSDSGPGHLVDIDELLMPLGATMDETMDATIGTSRSIRQLSVASISSRFARDLKATPDRRTTSSLNTAPRQIPQLDEHEMKDCSDYPLEMAEHDAKTYRVSTERFHIPQMVAFTPSILLSDIERTHPEQAPFLAGWLARANLGDRSLSR